MSTFAKSAFNASVYSASRPTYPAQLFEHIFSFHRQREPTSARWERAVDVGCGTGQATVHLRPFREVVAVDPSAGMLDEARDYLNAQETLFPTTTTQSPFPSFNFFQGSAENLRNAIPKDGSVDLLVAAQAAHWFNWNKVWPETHRVLHTGGTAAFWVYGEFRLPQYPSLAPMITEFAQGSSPLTSLGTYFQRPGRTILERLLVDVPEPSIAGLTKLERVYFCGNDVPDFIPKNAPNHPVLMSKEMRWRDLLAYFRTWSSLLTYHEKFPEDLEREDDIRFLEDDRAAGSETPRELEGGDIAIRFWKNLRSGALESSKDAQVKVDDKVMVEWPLALLLTRKQ